MEKKKKKKDKRRYERRNYKVENRIARKTIQSAEKGQKRTIQVRNMKKII